jgi:hypothetical protein
LAVADTALVLATSGRTLHVFDLYGGSLRLLIRPGGDDAPSGAGARAAPGLGLPPAEAAAAAATGGGGGWLASLGTYEWDEARGRWAALVGAAGGMVAAHCLENGRLLWRLHSRGTAAIVGLQLQRAPPWGAGPRIEGQVLFGLDAASYLHAWGVPEDPLPGGGGGGGNSDDGQLQRPGVGALLGSCRLGSARLGLPTSLLLPARGGTALLASGWGGVLCVVGAQRLPAAPRGGSDGGGSDGGGSDGGGGDGGGGGGSRGAGSRPGRPGCSGSSRVGSMEMGVVRTCDLGRALPGRTTSNAAGAVAEAAGATGSGAPAAATAGREEKRGCAPPASSHGGLREPTRTGSSGSGHGGTGGAAGARGLAAPSQKAILSLAMLEGGRLLAGLADGSVLLLRFS